MDCGRVAGVSEWEREKATAEKKFQNKLNTHREASKGKCLKSEQFNILMAFVWWKNSHFCTICNSNDIFIGFMLISSARLHNKALAGGAEKSCISSAMRIIHNVVDVMMWFVFVYLKRAFETWKLILIELHNGKMWWKLCRALFDDFG